MYFIFHFTGPHRNWVWCHSWNRVVPRYSNGCRKRRVKGEYVEGQTFFSFEEVPLSLSFLLLYSIFSLFIFLCFSLSLFICAIWFLFLIYWLNINIVIPLEVKNSGGKNNPLLRSPGWSKLREQNRAVYLIRSTQNFTQY